MQSLEAEVTSNKTGIYFYRRIFDGIETDYTNIETMNYESAIRFHERLGKLIESIKPNVIEEKRKRKIELEQQIKVLNNQLDILINNQKILEKELNT